MVVRMKPSADRFAQKGLGLWVFGALTAGTTFHVSTLLAGSSGEEYQITLGAVVFLGTIALLFFLMGTTLIVRGVVRNRRVPRDGQPWRGER